MVKYTGWYVCFCFSSFRVFSIISVEPGRSLHFFVLFELWYVLFKAIGNICLSLDTILCTLCRQIEIGTVVHSQYPGLLDSNPCGSLPACDGPRTYRYDTVVVEQHRLLFSSLSRSCRPT